MKVFTDRVEADEYIRANFAQIQALIFGDTDVVVYEKGDTIPQPEEQGE